MQKCTQKVDKSYNKCIVKTPTENISKNIDNKKDNKNNRNIIKNKEKRGVSVWQLFLKTMRTMGKRRYIYYSAILGMSISFAMFSVMEAFLMKVVVDIAQKGEWDRLVSSVVFIIIIGIISLLVYRVACIRYNVEAKKIYGKLYEQVLQHEMKLPCEYYENHHSGELLSKVSFDLGRMGDIFGSRFRRVVMPFIMVIVFLVPMFMLSWQLTLCLVIVNTILIGITMVLTGPLKKLSKKMSESNSIMTKHITDIIQGIIQVRMFEAGRKTIDKYNTEADIYADKSDKRNIVSSLLECANVGFDLICNLVFLALGIFFVHKGYTTLGAIAAIYTMYGRFSRQFLQMGKYIPELIAYLTYAQNIFDFLDEKTEVELENNREYNNKYMLKKAKDMDYSVEINNLTFSYIRNENDEPIVILDNYNECIKKGEFVAVTGASGSGKTTLSKLLMGFYKPDAGRIIVCGNNLNDISLSDGRSLFALVPQDAILFDMSIMDNIRMGRLDATEDEIIEAAKMANAHQFITEFIDGYDTIVGEKGTAVSGGQRQRIAIARAILKKAPIMLMDEATSALDNESERAVNQTLQNLKGKMTIIMIAHRTSTIQMADRVITL